MLFPIIYRLVVFPEATLKDMWDLEPESQPRSNQNWISIRPLLTLDQLNYKSGMQRQRDTLG
jgi:hypothetical protein